MGLVKTTALTDTDSVIYLKKEGENLVEYGDKLGDMTDELGGGHFTAFCSAGKRDWCFTPTKPPLQ